MCESNFFILRHEDSEAQRSDEARQRELGQLVSIQVQRQSQTLEPGPGCSVCKNTDLRSHLGQSQSSLCVFSPRDIPDYEEESKSRLVTAKVRWQVLLWPLALRAYELQHLDRRWEHYTDAHNFLKEKGKSLCKP